MNEAVPRNYFIMGVNLWQYTQWNGGMMEKWNIGFQMRMMPYFNSGRSRSKYNRSNTTNPSIPIFPYPKGGGEDKAD